MISGTATVGTADVVVVVSDLTTSDVEGSRVVVEVEVEDDVVVSEVDVASVVSGTISYVREGVEVDSEDVDVVDEVVTASTGLRVSFEG